MTTETLQQKLTPRELEVARLVSQDLEYEEIASQLCITPGTVYDHVLSIRLKLNLRSRVGVAVWYIQNNRVTPITIFG